MSNTNSFDRLYALEQLRRSKNPIRRIIKNVYLKNILKDVIGPTLDIGCGAGQLLARLPKYSLGLELNKHLIQELSSIGYNVKYYDLIQDNYSFSFITTGEYKTIVLSHVLEHFSESSLVLREILCSAERIGIKKVIIVVPGKKGYESDSTHKTFVDRNYIKSHDLETVNNFKITSYTDFPFPFEIMGSYFVYQELKIVYSITSNCKI
jgi:SAM-dependent methyltransferase